MRDILRMAGPPRRIYLLDPIEGNPESVRVISNEAFRHVCKNGAIPCRARQRSGGAVNLKIRLPADTAPGTYTVQLQIDSHQYDVALEVQPQAKLRMFPKSLLFSAKPGAKIEATISMENSGNTSIAIPETAVANIYRLQDIPSAFAKTFQRPVENHESLSESLLVELKRGYGGVMKFRLEGNHAALPPGSKSVFVVNARVPKTARSGCNYTGMMHIDRFHLMFEINVL